MKGLFIPGIKAEMFRNGCLESIEALMAEGEIYDVDYPLEQKQKTGHWIMTSDYYTGAYGTIDYVKCSCCGKDSLEEGNFCPNCGAKMVEPKESDVV